MTKYLSCITLLLGFLLTATGGFAADTSIINVYDAGGNLVSGDGQYYEYDDANQLVRVRQGDQTGTVVAEYFYDSSGQRVKKIENGVATYYVGKHYETQVGGTNAGNTSYYFAEGGERVAKKGPSGSVYYYHLDHLDGINVVTDAAGSTVARSDYLPFGDTRSDSTGADKYSYTGKEKDKTDLYYFEARYNSPANRHFTQADVAEPDYDDPQDLNRYAYVGNNPLSFVDYDGFKKKKKAKLSKREKYLIAHGRNPDKDKTPLKTAKKQEKAKEKAAALWAKQHPANSLQVGAGYSLMAKSSESNTLGGEKAGLNDTEKNSVSSKNNVSQRYSAEDLRNIGMDEQTNETCGMKFGYAEQKTGCDSPADKLNMSAEALQCCAIHDACYTAHRCNSSSWTAGCGSCQDCNSDVVACIERVVERVANQHPIKFRVNVLKGFLTGEK